MKHLKSLFATALCGVVLCGAATLQAAEVKTYQVTGPVLAVTPTTITVKKGEDEWQIARNNETKLPADIKPGTKVTVYYRMVATEVEVKEKKTKQ